MLISTVQLIYCMFTVLLTIGATLERS